MSAWKKKRGVTKMESRRIHLSQGLSQDAVRNGKCATIDSPSPQPHCKDLRPCAISIPRLCCLFFLPPLSGPSPSGGLMRRPARKVNRGPGIHNCAGCERCGCEVRTTQQCSAGCRWHHVCRELVMFVSQFVVRVECLVCIKTNLTIYLPPLSRQNSKACVLRF